MLSNLASLEKFLKKTGSAIVCVCVCFFPQFFNIRNLEYFFTKIEKLVEFTLGKKKFQNFPNFLGWKNHKKFRGKKH